MSRIKDLRIYKTRLREFYKNKRKNLDKFEKNQKDIALLENLLKLYKFKSCKTVLTYVSLPLEVDTKAFINHCFKLGKSVAVPYCIPNTRNIDFYYINSLNDLTTGTFSVLEPDITKSQKVTDFSDSICILPGLCFDKKGYRLGYGKGYYDRFLANYDNTVIGLCYIEFMRNNLIHGRFDRRADIVVTDKKIFRTNL